MILPQYMDPRGAPSTSNCRTLDPRLSYMASALRRRFHAAIRPSLYVQYWHHDQFFQQLKKMFCPPFVKVMLYIISRATVTVSTWVEHLKHCKEESTNMCRNTYAQQIPMLRPCRRLSANHPRQSVNICSRIRLAALITATIASKFWGTEEAPATLKRLRHCT